MWCQEKKKKQRGDMTRSAGYNLFLECEKGSPEGDRCIKA